MATSWHPTMAEIIFAVLLVIIPWSFSEIPLIWKCIMWMLAWGMILHLAFSFVPIAVRMPIVVKIALSVGMTGFLVAGSYSGILRAWHEEKAAATEGDLTAPSDGKTYSDNDVKFQIGPLSNGTVFNWTGPRNGSIFTIVGSKLSLRRERGKLLLSTEVRDRSAGIVVVSIVDNHWTVSKSQSVVWDKNYTSNTLEVKDGRGRVVLQVIMLPDRVQIQGEWWHEDGNGGRIVRPFPFDSVKTGPVFVIMTPLFQTDEPRIEPIFKYPSKDRFGELDESVMQD
jgi:hypothetical protein